jgi:alanyl-tRNA synthetase
MRDISDRLIIIQMQNRLAHTAEHAFIGSMQKLLVRTLNVRKVEHRDYDNLVIIKATDLDMDIIIKAEQEVNSLITQGRRILTHTFRSLDEAKNQIPNLRANENRIVNNQLIRVVEIEGLDWAACVMDHAANLKECSLFLITGINKVGAEFEINFVVSDAAKNTALDISTKILNICKETGANYNTIEETTKKLKQINRLYLQKLKVLTQHILDHVNPRRTHDEGPWIISGTFVGLLDEQVREFASKKIAETPIVVVLANFSSNGDSMANVVFARNESLFKIDCNRMFKEITSEWGRGGGKSNFVTGVIRKENVDEFITTIIGNLVA